MLQPKHNCYPSYKGPHVPAADCHHSSSCYSWLSEKWKSYVLHAAHGITLYYSIKNTRNDIHQIYVYVYIINSQFNSRSPQQFFTYFHRDDGAMVMICLSKVAHLIRLHRGFVEFQVLAVAQAETPILCEFAPTDWLHASVTHPYLPPNQWWDHSQLMNSSH